MAKVRIMYWKEIPVQAQARDESGAVSRQLDARFQEGVDAVAMFDGSMGTDDYLMAWEWGEWVEAPGSAADAADAAAARLNGGLPARLRVADSGHGQGGATRSDARGGGSLDQ